MVATERDQAAAEHHSREKQEENVELAQPAVGLLLEDDIPQD